MSTDASATAHSVFAEHLAQRDFWAEVARLVKDELSAILRDKQIPGKVEARAKTSGSVVGKVMRKPDRYFELSAFGDLAAARALVPFPSDVEEVASSVRSHPGWEVIEDDPKRRAPDSLEYQAHHLEVVLNWDYFDSRVEPPGVVKCEIQIHTLAQSLWASVSHLITYKRENLPEDVRSRVNRLIVLCELFDDEIEASRAIARESLDLVSATVRDLDRYYASVTGAADPPTASPEIVANLAEVFANLPSYPSILEKFVSDFGPRLVHHLKDSAPSRMQPWFHRPEAILIFEGIQNRPAQLRRLYALKLGAASAM